MQAFVDIPIREERFECLLPLANHSIVSSLWADDDVLIRPASWLHSKLPCVADMLASLVTSRVTNITGVATLALAMLTEFVWTAELAIPALKTVPANASTTTILTHVALTPVRALVTLTFDFRTRVALQTCFQHFAESIHLEAVSEEALAASGTLNGIVHSPVFDCIHMH